LNLETKPKKNNNNNENFKLRRGEKKNNNDNNSNNKPFLYSSYRLPLSFFVFIIFGGIRSHGGRLRLLDSLEATRAAFFFLYFFLFFIRYSSFLSL
jgi:hypothetical protein